MSISHQVPKSGIAACLLALDMNTHHTRLCLLTAAAAVGGIASVSTLRLS
jgi:hypothetical protein